MSSTFITMYLTQKDLICIIIIYPSHRGRYWILSKKNRQIMLYFQIVSTLLIICTIILYLYHGLLVFLTLLFFVMSMLLDVNEVTGWVRVGMFKDDG